jgi:hypothetical protein
MLVRPARPAELSRVARGGAARRLPGELIAEWGSASTMRGEGRGGTDIGEAPESEKRMDGSGTTEEVDGLGGLKSPPTS